jgi:tetratricopeptide (TPR) repeat protein
LARSLAERGAFDEAYAHGQEGIQLAETLDHPNSLGQSCVSLAYVDSVRGEWSRATLLLERALVLSREWNLTIVAPRAMAMLGYGHAWSGRIGDGVAWLHRAEATFESTGVGAFHSISLAQLGEAQLLAGQIGDARVSAERAVKLARERGERGHEAWALRLLAEVASQADRPDVTTTEAQYGAAMALASELGMRPLIAHCHVGLGTLYRKTGDEAKAHEHLTTAATMYREMAMSFWLERVAALLGTRETNAP